MESNRCPGAEDWAVFAAGGASEAEWRRRVRHLAECGTCRRHSALLSLSEGSPFPPALLSAPPPPLVVQRRRSFARILLSTAAAAVFLGAMAFALHRLNRVESIGPAAVPETPIARPERSGRPGPLPEWPKALKPRPAPGDRRPELHEFVPPPPPGLLREDPPPPPPPPPPHPLPNPPAPPR
jgi:hypothetical protein